MSSCLSTMSKRLQQSFALLAGAQFVFILVLVLLVNTVQAQMTAGNAYTIAGNGFTGVINGPLSQAEFAYPGPITRDRAGNIYVADWRNYLIRKIDSSGNVTTFAGPGSGSGYILDEGPAINSRVGQVDSLVVDTSGNVYFASATAPTTSDGRGGVFEITTDGILHVFAGGSNSSNYGDGGPPTQAYLGWVYGLAFDANGQLFISTAAGIRIVSNGVISTFAPGHAPTTIAGLSWPGNDLALDHEGNVYIAADCSIQKMTPAGVVTFIIGSPSSLNSCVPTGDGGPASAATVGFAQSMVFDASDNLYFTDCTNVTHTYYIRKVTSSTGIVSTVVGTGADHSYPTTNNIPALSATIDQAQGLTFDASGSLYFGDGYSDPDVIEIYQLAPPPKLQFTPGIITTVVGYPGSTITGGGDYEYTPNDLGYSGDGGPATSAQIINPGGIAVKPDSSFYFADSGNNVIRYVDTSGLIHTIAGNGNVGYSGDTGLATAAQLNAPSGVALDRYGNIYIADGNPVIRVIYKGGTVPNLSNPVIDHIYTIAGTGSLGFSGDGSNATLANFGDLLGVSIDQMGSILISDNVNWRIRKVDSSGIVNTVAGNGNCSYVDGGLAASSPFCFSETATDYSNNIFAADEADKRIREISSTSGILSTFAGGGDDVSVGTLYCPDCTWLGSSIGDGGPAVPASVSGGPIAFDPGWNLFIGDNNHRLIRRVDKLTNIISTVAGIIGDPPTYCDTCGDGGSALNAYLNPGSIAFDSAGNYLVSDVLTNRIRMVRVNQSALPYVTTTTVGSVDSTDGPQSLTVTNTGNGTMTFVSPSSGTNPSIDADFAYNSSSTCPLLNPGDPAFTLAPGASCTYLVDFIPTRSGDFSESLVLTTNDPNTPSAVVTLTGSGLASNCHRTRQGIVCTE